MSNINNILEFITAYPISVIGIVILILFLIAIIIKKMVKLKIIFILIIALAILFIVMAVKYNSAVMPDALKTDQLYRLEKTLTEEYSEISGIETKVVGGVEISSMVLLSEKIDEDVSKDVLHKIRSVLIGKEFEKDIQSYYWHKYYQQFSFEVKYILEEETLYSYHAKRGVNLSNINLAQWDAYNHMTDVQFKVSF